MKKLLLPILAIFAMTFMACEDPKVDDPDNPNTEKPDEPDNPDDPDKPDPDTKTYNVEGAIQKGPFVQGSSITISELDDELNPTGVNYKTTTNDDTGSFEMNSKINSRFVEITAEGYYFNEVSGKISSSELTLRTISDLESSDKVNINLLTSLANDKLKSLIKAGGEDYTFSQALLEAEKDVLDAFGLEDNDEHFDKMDITKAGDANAMLLAVSVTLQGNCSVGEMSELIAKIAAEIESYGKVQSPNLKNAIQKGAVGVDLADVRQNLQDRYDDLGASCEIPDFENFIDSDGNGKIDSNEAWLLVDGEQDFAVDNLSQAISVEIERNIDYNVTIEYESDEVDWINYYVTPMTRSDIQYETITFELTELTGYDSRSASITLSNPNDASQHSTISIEQSPKGALILGKSDFNLPTDGGVIEVSFSTNESDYNVEVENDAAEWIKIASDSRATTMQEYTKEITVLPNSQSDTRTGRVVVTAGDNVDYITITQTGEEILYFKDGEDIEASWAGGEFYLTVVHNGKYRLDWRDSDYSCWNSWSHRLISDGEKEDVYCISMPAIQYDENIYDNDLYCEIALTSETGSTQTQTIRIEQFSHPQISVDKVNSTLSSSAHDNLTLTARSNNPIEVEFDAEWITLVEAYKYTTIQNMYRYTFSIASNSGYPRNADITFLTKYNDRAGNPVQDVVTISQSGDANTSLTIDCQTPGRLSDYISDIEQTSTTELIVTGEIKLSDIYCIINPMTQLEILDLSGVRITENYILDDTFTYKRDMEDCRLHTLILPSYDIELKKGFGLADKLEYIDFGGVTTIPMECCENYTKLETVVANSAKTIESSAFFNTTLQEIEIKNVTYIQSKTFAHCTNLESIIIPGSVKVLGSSVFYMCNKLKSVTLSEGIEELGLDLFYGCESLVNLTLPSTLKVLDEAFSNSSLRSLVIPRSVETIRNSAFLNCADLESLTFEEGSKLKGIDSKYGSCYVDGEKTFYSVFRGCTSLKSITIPASVESIFGAVFGDSSFEEILFEEGSSLTSLEGIQIEKSSYTEWNIRYAGCFENCPATSIELPSSLRTLGSHAFKGSNFEVLDLQNVYALEESALAGAKAHTIKLPYITKLEGYTFYHTENLATLEMPRVKVLDDYEFGYSDYISGDWSSDQFEEVGNGTFEGCPMTSVSLPNVTEIGNEAFSRCPNLRTVNLPKLEATGYGVFIECPSIDYRSLVFENFTIVPNIFQKDETVTEVTQAMFPNATTIGYGSFKEAKNLETIDFEKVETVESNAFYLCEKLTNINLPKVTQIDDWAFANCSGIKSFDCAKLTKLDGVFSACENLEELTNVDNITYFSLSRCDKFKSTSDWPSLEILILSLENITEFTSSSPKLRKANINECDKLRTLSFTKTTDIDIWSLTDCNMLESIEIGTEATSYITNIDIVNNIPYSMAVTLRIGEYDPDIVNFIINGDTLEFKDGSNPINFREIIVVDNL